MVPGVDWTARGTNPVGARFSASVQTGLGAHPASCTMGTRSLPRGYSGRGVALTTHTLAQRFRKAELYRYCTSESFLACSMVNCTFLYFYKFYCAKIIYNMYKSKVYKTLPLTSLHNLKSL